MEEVLSHTKREMTSILYFHDRRIKEMMKNEVFDLLSSYHLSVAPFFPQFLREM